MQYGSPIDILRKYASGEAKPRVKGSTRRLNQQWYSRVLKKLISSKHFIVRNAQGLGEREINTPLVIALKSQHLTIGDIA